MGCGASKHPKTKHKPGPHGSSHSLLKLSSGRSVGSKDDELTIAAEAIRLKNERDQQVFQEIQAEKAALRAIATVMIEQRNSCESLLDLLEKSEIEELTQHPDSHRLQKAATIKIHKAQADKKPRWVVYNNVNAIDEASIDKITEFMHYAITGACEHTDGEFNLITSSFSESRADSPLPRMDGAIDIDNDTLWPPSPPVLSLEAPGQGKGHTRRRTMTGLRNVSDTYEYGTSPSSSPARDVTYKRKSTGRRATLDFGLLDVMPPPSGVANGLSGPITSPTVNSTSSAAAGSSVDKPSLSVGDTNNSKTNGSGNTNTNTNSSGGSNSSSSVVINSTNAKVSSQTPFRQRTNTITGVLHVSEVEADLKKQLLSLNILTVAPQRAFRISEHNIGDYDFAPGLVTLGVASAVIELFKRGGRLTPRSVHKLLRLGYRSFKSRPNTTRINISGDDRLTVVGDIHGQLSDLLHILDSSGLPSPTNRYLFNGDFVDRGAYGVEVMCVLLVLHAAMPDYVTLNRGNHEDYAICTAYGFQMECFEKYGELIFGMFVEVFQQIPLFAVVNDSVFVLHGGLFHTKDATLADLNAIKRTTFSLEDLPEGGEGTTEVPRYKRKDWLKQLVRDALWSDPVNQQGMHPSVRGAGIGFGPDVTRVFLNTNRLSMVVRSHECVRSGYNEPYTGEDRGLLSTIFSASDYGASGNSAAYMVFTLNKLTPAETQEALENAAEPGRKHRSPSAEDAAAATSRGDVAANTSHIHFVRNSRLCFRVHYFYIADKFRDGANIVELHKNDVHPPGCGLLFSRDVYAMLYGGDGDDNDDSGTANSTLDNTNNNSTADLMNGAAVVAESNTDSTLVELKQQAPEAALVDAVGAKANRLKKFDSLSALVEHRCRPSAEQQSMPLIGLSISLYELILEKKYALQEVFAVVESTNLKTDGVVTRAQFCMVLTDVLRVPVQWIKLLPVLLSENHFRSIRGKRMIDYTAFLNQFLELKTVPKGDTVEEEEEDPSLDALGRYLKAMEKLAKQQKAQQSSSSGASGAKDVPETVKVSRTVSASAVDVSHHLKNLSAYEKKPLHLAKTTDNTEPGAGPKAPSVPVVAEKKLEQVVPAVPSRVRCVSDSVTDLEQLVTGGGAGKTGAATLPTDTSSTSTVAGGKGGKDGTATSADNQNTTTADESESGEYLGTFHNYLVTEDLLDVLYTDFGKLEHTFRFFDRDNKGYLTRGDIQAGCDRLSSVLPDSVHFPPVDELMRILDVHGSGEVDMNLFFEMFRLADSQLKAHTDEDDDPDSDIVTGDLPPPLVLPAMSRDASLDNLASLSMMGTAGGGGGRSRSNSGTARSLSLSLSTSVNAHASMVSKEAMAQYYEMQQAQGLGHGHNYPHSPTSPTHRHAAGVRNDSHSSLAIKGVNINVDEITTGTVTRDREGSWAGTDGGSYSPFGGAGNGSSSNSSGAGQKLFPPDDGEDEKAGGR